MTIFDSIILGLIEGFTEFLPISSTGHLILTSKLLGIEQSDIHKSFEIMIQLAAIFAVVFFYFDRFRDKELLKKLIIAFIPTGVLGFFLYKHIKSLFDFHTVAFMLIFGGIVLIAIEL
jgi:undecaprenyl-diphosphatase